MKAKKIVLTGFFMDSMVSDILLHLARKSWVPALQASAFRKFCRRNRGRSFSIETAYGFHFNTIIGDAVDNQVFVYRQFESSTSNLMSCIAGECRAFVDVGCNIGYFSCLFSQCNPAAQLYCIDANPRMVERTRSNLELNGRSASFLNFGISNTEDTLKLFIAKGRHSLSSFAYRPEKGGEIEEISVHVDRLGKLVDFNNLSDACLKVDTEGFEYNVFDGIDPAESARLKYIVFECNNGNMAKAGQNAQKIFDIPWLQSFYAYVIDDAPERLTPIDVEQQRFPENANVLLINKSLGSEKARQLTELMAARKF